MHNEPENIRIENGLADMRRREATMEPIELPSPEPAGPASSLAVATGWVPVSSVEALLEIWAAREATATSYKEFTEAMGLDGQSYARAAKSYALCIKEVRALIAAATVRQPAPNKD